MNIVIYDFQGNDTKKNLNADYVKETMKYTKGFYPESISVLLAFNVNTILKVAYNMVKGLMAERTREKI